MMVEGFTINSRVPVGKAFPLLQLLRIFHNPF
jgi:hypothetical protein